MRYCGSRVDSTDRAGEATRRRRRARARAAAVLFAMTLAACSSGRSGRTAVATPARAWPGAPDPARIELVSEFGAGSDLGIQPPLWSRVVGFLSGGGEARLRRPTGVSAAGGRIAVADPGAMRVHLYDTTAAQAWILDACGKEALVEPVGVALVGDSLLVTDAATARVLVYDRKGNCTASWPLEEGSRPSGIAADAAGTRIYVTEAGRHRVGIFDSGGHRIGQFGQRGAGPGEFNYPTWLAVDAAGNLAVTDALNFRVQFLDGQGHPLGAFGRQGDGSGEVSRPKGVAVDRDGHVHLVDSLFDAVQIFDRDGTFLMAYGDSGRGPGAFSLPSGLAIDGDRIYVADSYNRRVQVLRYLGGQP